jgi:hypothetical protein
VPVEKRSECWWLILQDGTPVAGDGGGGVLLLAELSLTHPLGQVLHTLRLSPLVDAGDRFLAKYRKRLGRFVPEGAAPRRFP